VHAPKRGFPTWFPLTPDPKNLLPQTYAQYSLVVPSFSEELCDNLPVALMPAAFQVYVVPTVPVGYRWKCELFYDPWKSEADQKTIGLRMRSTRKDLDEVFELPELSGPVRMHLHECSFRPVQPRSASAPR
jgi:hypothetical protein